MGPKPARDRLPLEQIGHFAKAVHLAFGLDFWTLDIPFPRKLLVKLQMNDRFANLPDARPF
jgi:hypothetical protein